MKLILKMLPDGALPIMAYDGPWHYIHGEPYGTPLEWQAALTHRRAVVQLFEVRLDLFLEFLAKGLPMEGVLYLPLRSSYELEGLEGKHLLVGGAVFQFDIPEIVERLPDVVYPYEHIIEGDISLIEKFCTLGFLQEEPSEVSLQATWRELRARKLRYEEVHRLQIEVQERSLRLLQGHLDEIQLQELSSKCRFITRGRDGRRYLITYRQHGNVYLLDDADKPVTNYCIVIDDEVPLYDQMLGQKLLLEHDLESFLKIANATPLSEVERDPPEPVE